MNSIRKKINKSYYVIIGSLAWAACSEREFVSMLRTLCITIIGIDDDQMEQKVLKIKGKVTNLGRN